MLSIYSTLSRKKEALKPLANARGKKLKLFVCGPTVYDLSHIGHARTYLAFDMIVKYLKQTGYGVFYLQNITDIDDKIINRAKETKTAPSALASRFEKEYLKDMKAIKVNSVAKYARATLHIKEIISQVKRLIKKGFAYKIEDGIYYDISKFKDYGKLSKRTALGAESAVSRIDESVGKKNKGDFCLWKISKSGEPKWSFGSTQDGSAIPDGRPGWHIEDTAITEKYFGPQYDIHGGARDLIFPHHEAEISQMEAISDKKPLVKYWLHAGFLTVEGQKMSKSLGNFITIKEFLKKYHARLLRFLILKNHYRSPIDYSENSVLQSEKELKKIDEFVGKLQIPSSKSQTNSKIKISKFKTDFDKAMEDDFNTPEAMATIFELISHGNSLMDKNLLNTADAKDILKFFKKIDGFFNFIFWPKAKEKIPQELSRLVGQRQEYRERGDWQKADEIRKEIQKLGWQIEDTKSGPKIKRL